MSRKPIQIKAGDKYNRLTIIKEVEPRVYRNGQKDRKVLARAYDDYIKENNLPNQLNFIN